MILTTADAGAVLVGWTILCFLLDRIRRFCQVLLKSGQRWTRLFFGMMTMPMPKENDDLVDPDLVPRPVMAVGRSIVTGTGGMEVRVPSRCH
jgi:hypothetical protein